TQLAAGGRALVGAAVVQAEPHIAAFVEAWDPAMKHLTITQPAGSAFLSPVLLFPQTVTIVDQALPSDGFATPAREREVKAVYFSAVAAARAHRPEPGPAILFAVDDQRSQRVLPGGIGFAASGETVALGGLRLRATLGSYPALVVSAAPYPPALGLGIALVLAGLIATAIGLRPSSDRDELFTRTTSS
ncbi:MAG: hypothetical protein ACREQ5_31005, partial [Candidatus Dormibacteria bacterium]